MPTGYTAGVVDGTITDFPTFAMQCARAFGSLISMRDDAWDAEIPESFEPDSYHAVVRAEAGAKLAAFAAATDDELRQQWKSQHAANVQRVREANDRIAVQALRCREMLAHAENWLPPTTEHVGLRDFMVQQLTETLRFDGKLMSEPEPVAFDTWKEERHARLTRDVEYHRKSEAEDIERARERTQWVRDLRESLRGEQ